MIEYRNLKKKTNIRRTNVSYRKVRSWRMIKSNVLPNGSVDEFLERVRFFARTCTSIIQKDYAGDLYARLNASNINFYCTSSYDAWSIWRDTLCYWIDVLRHCHLVSARIYMLNRVSLTIGNGLLRSNTAMNDNENGGVKKRKTNTDRGHNKNVYRTSAIKINLLYIDELQWALQLDGTDLSRYKTRRSGI